MLVESLPTQFGRAEFYQEFEHNGRLGGVVIEMWNGRHWIIIYNRQNDSWVAAERYAVCGLDGLPPWVRQEYAPRWCHGASVDGDGGYIVVEKSDRVWLLLYDGDVEYCCLLDVIEIPSLDVVPYPVDRYRSYLLDNTALVRLREVLPVLANICDVYLIETVAGRIAYMAEDIGLCRQLFRYLWAEETWLLEGPFEAVDPEVGEGVMPQRITDITGIFEGRTAHGVTRIVVEDGIHLRWWHTYVLHSSEWLLDSTHHAVVEDDEDGGMIEEIGEEAESGFLDEAEERGDD
jgi:hypothetical protein